MLALGVVYGFGVPVAAGWGWTAAVLALLVVASLGLGFVIAGWARSDSQAIQFSMLTLLFT
ncbi:MAG: hypothetical protein GWN07_30675, partial [Actinobacteria bacterium]|nr:hypothetical protein [Actinomycetota bacterium]NIU69747.1 hypothetical protein [Actinomycetota bacterium]NIW31623.1 hypothetical protein [Actinomycetota bacterium]NIX23949.1 hypothetical protein [Actinomycetota bacterium]